ncbi:MBL fold metallo-hydrolase [Pediococcus argentinicus]|uniref:MBL fold metallo-hydrolase n=1 Tax=Pediococcus argentinicus TaxID=480391 RepID=UPI00338F75F8
MTNLKYEVLTDKRDSSTRGLPAGTEDLQWVANSATLIYGESDAVLVDTFMTIDANNKLIDWIKDHHVNLKYIYVTHAHSDHFFGAGMLKDAFPEVQIIATQATADGIPYVIMPAMIATVWNQLFPNQIPDHLIGVDQVVTDSFEIEGHQIKILQDKFTDTHDSTSLWIPDLKLIVAGDATYNGVHPFMAETTLPARENWIQVNKDFKALNPEHVVAGHKVPENDDNPVILDETIKYIETFNKLSKQAKTGDELFNAMMNIYGERINPGSLWGVSHAVIR